MKMGKLITVLGGLISIVLGVWGLITWWYSFVTLLKGCVPPILILGGLAALFAGISEMKDSCQAKKEETKAPEKK
jgi:putative Mn2+ efflux pump MntP